jgi:hypothetical protein
MTAMFFNSATGFSIAAIVVCAIRHHSDYNVIAYDMSCRRPLIFYGRTLPELAIWITWPRWLFLLGLVLMLW